MLIAAAGVLMLAINSVNEGARRLTGKPARPRGGSQENEPAPFETLLRSHAARGNAIEALERQLRKTLARDPAAVIEAERIATQTGQPLQTVQQLRSELGTNGGLETRYLWRCPRGLGTSAEAKRPTGFPMEIECERCNDMHTTDPKDIDEVLVATESLQRELGESGPLSRLPRTETIAPHPTR